MEQYFDAAYRRFSDRTKQHQAVLADTVLQFTFLRERDAAVLEDLMSSKNLELTSAQKSKLNDIDDDDDDFEVKPQRKVRFSTETRDSGTKKKKKTKAKTLPFASSPLAPPPSEPNPRLVEINRRTLLLCDDARSSLVLEEGPEELYTLRISVPRHGLALVAAKKTFSHYQSLQETAMRFADHFSAALPAFPTSPASQRLGFKLSPAQLDQRRTQLQTYVACIVACFPELSSDAQDTLVDALDLDIQKWEVRGPRPDIDVMAESDLDVDVLVRLEYDHYFSSSSVRRTPYRKKVIAQKAAEKKPPARIGWWARLKGDDDDEETAVEEEKEEPKKIKPVVKKMTNNGGDPRLEKFDDEEPPWGRQDDEVFPPMEETKKEPTMTSEKKSEAVIIDDEERAVRSKVLPKAIELTEKLRRADLCLLIQIEGVTNLAKAVEGYASKSPRWYVCAKVLEDGVVIQDPQLLQRTPTRKEDEPDWTPFAPVLFTLPDAPDAATWARRTVKFEVYDANLLPPQRDKTITVPPPKIMPLSGEHGLDHPAAMVCHATLAGLTEFEYALPGDDDFDYDEPCFTSLALDLIDADNRISNGAQLQTRICLTAADIALDYAAVGVAAVIRYDTFKGKPFKESYYSSLCNVCVPTFLYSSESSQYPSSSSTPSTNRSMTISNAAFPDRKRHYDDDWAVLGYFKVTDFCAPLAETPTKFDLLRDPDITAVAPLEDNDEKLLEDWHLSGLPETSGFSYAPSFSATKWVPVQTTTTNIRRSVWYRLAKRRVPGDDDDDQVHVQRPEPTTPRTNGGLQRSRSLRLQRRASSKKVMFAPAP